MLHLQAATEVLLKARLQREHWILVFKKPETATQSAFDSVDFESCTTDEDFTRLTRICGLDLPDKGIEAVGKLARDRNALQRYGMTAPAGAVEARAAGTALQQRGGASTSHGIRTGRRLHAFRPRASMRG
ncbi:hypothetical protein ACFYWY_29335 [Streptomyces sp. NPDC002870]|uniref:hypothetical protein n=1 Tax=Streptomyces sp. NPDC002870 TaxID=3364666 RepID=UPI00369DF036